MQTREYMGTTSISERRKFNSELFITETSKQLKDVEEIVEGVLVSKLGELPELRCDLHIQYLLRTLRQQSKGYERMDCSRTWMVYWLLHSLALLKYEVNSKLHKSLIEFLKVCQHPSGGFGGGPGQVPHLAPTYAAVCAICLLGTDEAFQIIDRKSMLKLLQKLKVGDGSFYMHEDGEIDIRSLYCCVVIYHILNLDDVELFRNSAQWALRCQTYEGGFAGNPGMEAHGGYTFCGLTTLYLLGKLEVCDLSALKRWVFNRQARFEGGFQGRTNKLVDSCYSFWQYGAIAIIDEYQAERKIIRESVFLNLINKKLLVEYLLLCCQHQNGGFMDKPGTCHDPYHTCYSLSGLSLAQSHDSEYNLAEIHPAYNIPRSALRRAEEYFGSLCPLDEAGLTERLTTPNVSWR